MRLEPRSDARATSAGSHRLVEAQQHDHTARRRGRRGDTQSVRSSLTVGVVKLNVYGSASVRPLTAVAVVSIVTS